MKNRTKQLSAAFIFFMAFNFANAQCADHKECKENKNEHPSAAKLITKMDSDNDKRLSKEEVKGPLSDHFAKIDTNNDGYLTQVELEYAPKLNKADRKRKRPSSKELISKMDVNNDGKLALTEVKGPLSDRFAKIDTNSDGYLTQVELENAPKPIRTDRKRKRPSSEELIDKMDENKDGKLSLTEVKGPLAKHFTKIDTNNDGFLTKVELDNAPKPRIEKREKS